MAASVLISTHPASAQDLRKFRHDATASETSLAIRANQEFHESSGVASAIVPFRPVEDTANFAYVLMSETTVIPEIAQLRETIARNLPDGVRLVILADESDAEQVRSQYSQWISPDRLIVAKGTDTSNGFWARDSFPLPVYDNSRDQASLVAAHYYRPFNAWDAIADAVHAPYMDKEGFTFVGGNLLADEDGNCFDVDSYRLFTVTVDDLKRAYGCKTVHLMKHVHGIGDVDEVLKPLPGKRILTNAPEYQAELESWGYQVILLPTLPENTRTYANSLIVHNTVFMPSYNVPQDAQARQVYESLGYKVIPVTSIEMSDQLDGSIHCQTMAYPPMEISRLLGALHARID